MEIKQVDALVNDIIGMPLWRFSIGPCGINIQFGKEMGPSKYGLTGGEISLWIQCNTQIFENHKLVFGSLFPQEEDEVTEYRKCLQDKIVIDSFVREKDRALVIIVEPEIAFISYPWTKESEKCWIVYDNRKENPPGIMIYTDDIVIAE